MNETQKQGSRKAPSTIGEWDQEIATLTGADLVTFRNALRDLRSWAAFNEAFKWTRMFVLMDSIQFEMNRRTRGDNDEPLPEVTR